MIAAKVATEIVELARERISDIRPPGLTGVGGQALDGLLIRAYLQGAVDGSSITQRRAASRGHYKKKGAT